MKDYDINDVLDQLYQIDEDGMVLSEKLNIIEDEFYQKLLENLKKSEREYMKAARLDAKKKTKQILAETIKDEQAIMETCYKETDRLDDIMENHKAVLIKKVFEHVFLKEVENG